MQSPLDAVVTIVIPHYNMVPLLLECLESVALQTVPAWEAIVVDDASTHGNVKKSISQVDDPRISLITLAQNQGLGAARNIGIKAARSQLVLPLDSDDRLHPLFLETTLRALRDNSNVDCVFTDFQLFGNSDEIWNYSVRSPSEILDVQWIPGPGTLMRKRVWENVGGYDEIPAPFCGNEDWDFWIAAVKNGLKAVHVSEPLYNYRRTAHSMSVSSLLYYDYVTRERIYVRHKAFFDHHKAGKRFRAGGYLRSASASLTGRERLRAARLALRGACLQPRNEAFLDIIYRALVPDWLQPLVYRPTKVIWKMFSSRRY